MTIVIPCYGEEVAPCFDAARHFRVWEMGAAELNAGGYRELTVGKTGGIERIRLLKRVGCGVLICNGIPERFCELLGAEGITVIADVVGSVGDALQDYITGKLRPVGAVPLLRPDGMQPELPELVAWTRELFARHDWQVQQVTQPGLFPIDLVALRNCPVCGRPVRVAVCCSGHAYRVDEEIREFRRVSAGFYNARVYVHRKRPEIVRTCRDFEIELLDPRLFASRMKEGVVTGDLPPLTGKITGHENINTAEESIQGNRL